jgi:hypothetical protein
MTTDRSLPASLPTIGPNEPHATIAMLECRTCGQHSAWVRTDSDGADNTWDAGHARATGHRGYYVWTLTRSTARVFL